MEHPEHAKTIGGRLAERYRWGDEKGRSVTPEQEIWAVALHVERQHGERAPVFIAERIGALALAGDQGGVDRWKAIAAALDQLRRGGPQPAQ